MPKKSSISQMKYDAVNRIPLHFMLNVKNDSDIIERLNSMPNTQGYIKRLIREDMIREQLRAEMAAEQNK